jgi:hypothetical protein
VEPVQDYLYPGAEFAGYQIQSLVARGGMGVVYRALDVQLGRTVALKLLAPELAANEKFRQRFVRESRLAASVDHPNILPIYAAGEWSGLLYIAMRFVHGTDVKAELDARGPLPLTEALSILSHTAAALDAAHGAGLVHRDVKPGNILLSDDPANGHRLVYLTDFGLTKRTTSATGVTTAGHFLGTLDYVAPEQIRGGNIDSRADVYALACVAYTLLAGHPPFDHDNDSAQLWAHMTEEPPRLTLERPEVPPAMEAAIVKGMAKQPEDRPPTCGALVTMMSGGSPGKIVPAQPRGAGKHAVPPRATTPGKDSNGGAPVEAGTLARAGGKAHLGGRSTGSRGRRAGRRPGRAARLTVLGGALLLLVLAILAGALLPPMLSGEKYVTFRADGVPYTLDVPQSWTARTHEAGDSTVSVLSDADLTALFADEPDAPAGAARTASEPEKVAGLAIYHRPAGLTNQSPATRVRTAEALLPGRDAHLVDRGPATVGEVKGQAMEGTIPLSSAVTLQVRVFVVETDPVQLLVFFAPSSLFEQRTETFDHVVGSLRRTK